MHFHFENHQIYQHLKLFWLFWLFQSTGSLLLPNTHFAAVATHLLLQVHSSVIFLQMIKHCKIQMKTRSIIASIFPNINIITPPSQHLGRVCSCEARHFMVTKNTFVYLALDFYISNKKVITWLGPQPLESDWPGLGNCFWPWSPCGKHVSPVYSTQKLPPSKCFLPPNSSIFFLAGTFSASSSQLSPYCLVSL